MRMPAVVAAALAAIAVLAAAPSASAALPQGFVGVTSEDVFVHAGPFRDRQLPIQRRAGVRLVRQTFDWSKVEVAPGIYDFSGLDRYVLDLARRGMRILPILFRPPEFRSSRPPHGARHGTYPPRSAPAMGAWAERLVDRYGPHGSLWQANPGVRPLPIRSWQIWNEPNLRHNWPRGPDARQYVRLLRTVGAAIKTRDRGAEIVTAGVARSRLRGAINILTYIGRIYRAGGATAFDTMAINSYARNAPALRGLIDGVRRTMNRRRDRRARIWITEFGWCSNRRVRHRFCVGPQQQARNITRSLRLIGTTRRRWRLRGFVYFSWHDRRPFAPHFRNYWGLHTGLLTLGDRRKPAFRAFTRGVRRLR